MDLLLSVLVTMAMGAADSPADSPPAAPAEVRVTGIRAVCRNGQTFVTWKDVAEGAAGAKYRYDVYRSDQPITQKNLLGAELCVRGILNNSAKLFGAAHGVLCQDRTAKPSGCSRRDPGAKPTQIAGT